MSDWRGETPEKEEKRKPKKMPAIARGEQNATAPTTKSDWRVSAGSSSTQTSGSPTTDRPWTGEPPTTDASGRGALRRTALLAGLLALIGTFVIGFVWWTRLPSHPIPVLTSVGTYGDKTSDLGVIPFAAHTLKTFKALEGNNVKRMSHRDPDYLLKTLKRGSGWVDQARNDTQGFARFIRKDGTISGGGDSGKLIFYYVSGFLARRSSDNEWVLLSDDDDPFAGQGLTLTNLFQRISLATPDDCYALVGLDLHIPTVITNLGDLSFPEAAIEKAFREFPRQTSDTSGSPKRGGRIVVAIPCSTGQENWVSPELSSSVFGYFFQRGIFTFFDDDQLTLESFQSELKKRVKDWVLQNRQALQEPVVLMDPETQAQANNLKFLWRFGAVGSPEEKLPGLEEAKRAALKSRYENLDGLWSRMQGLREGNAWNWNPMRRDPMRFARIESQLLLLEDIAERTLGEEEETETAPSQRWSRRIDDLKKEITEVEKEWNSDWRVSLVESEMQLGVGRDRSLKGDDSALLLWKELRSHASDPSERWTKFFNQGILQQLPQSSTSTASNPDWLELQLVRILHQEVDWSRNDQRDDAAKAIAHCLKTFGTLQELACRPNPELVPWIRETVLKCDQSFLKAVDLLVANRFKPCIDECSALQLQLDLLKQQVDILERAMLGRDRAIHFAPHALATLMRMGRYGVGVWTKEDIKQKAKGLARIVVEGQKLQDELKMPGEKLLSTNDLAEQIDAFEREFCGRLETWLSPEKGAGHPEAIRDMRIAVRFPFLDAASRAKYHENLRNLSQYTKATATDEAFDTTHCIPPSDVAKIFVEALGPEADDFLNAKPYTTIALNDQRAELKPISGNFESVEPKQLYEHAFLARTYANALGLRVLASASWKDAYPFDAPRRMQDMLDGQYATLQQDRLYRARWGDDRLEGLERKERGSDSIPFYFQQLANQYVSPSKSPAERQNALDAMNSLDSLEASDEETPDSIRVQGVAVKASLWRDAMASLHPGIGIPAAQSNATRITILPLGNGFPTSNQPLPIAFESFLPKKLYLSFRGHRRIIPVKSQAVLVRFTTNFQRDTESPTFLATMSSEKQSIVVLLDCSMSMGGNMTRAKNAVKKLLDVLQDQDKQGVSSQVSLMAFGVMVPMDLMKGSPFVISKAGGQDLIHSVEWMENGKKVGDKVAYANVIQTPFWELRTERQALEKAIDHPFVRPTHDTPLYSSVVSACELIEKEPEGIPRTIIVLSDGANRVAKVNIYRDSASGEIIEPPLKVEGSLKKGEATPIAFSEFASAADILKPLQRCKTQIYFYQISNSSDGPEVEKQNKAFNDVLAQYSNSSSLGKKETNYRDFDEVRDALVRSFALPQIQIEYLHSGSPSELLIPFNQRNPRPKLDRGRVRISAVRQDKAGDRSEEINKQRLVFDATGNEQFELVYKDGGFLFEGPKGEDGTPLLPYPKKLAPPMFGERPIEVQVKSTFLPEGPELNITFRDRKGRESKPPLPRPKFALATLRPERESPSPREDTLDEVILMADHHFSSSQHPTLQFPPIQLGEALKDWGLGTQAFQLDLWWSLDDLGSMDLDRFKTIEVDLGRDTKNLSVESIGEFHLTCAGEKLIVKRRMTKTDPLWFILCHDASQVTRRYLQLASDPDGGLEEEIQFVVAPSLQKTKLLFVKEADLQRMASRESEKTQTIFHHRGSGIKLSP